MSGGWEPWRLVEASSEADGWHHLVVRSGASTRELVAVAAGLPAACLVDVVPMDRAGNGAVLVFREFPAGTVADSAPWSGPGSQDGSGGVTQTAAGSGGWVPAVGGAAGPDLGLTPYELAVGELVRAAADEAEAARVVGMLGRVHPSTFVVLADMLHRAREARRRSG